MAAGIGPKWVLRKSSGYAVPEVSETSHDGFGPWFPTQIAASSVANSFALLVSLLRGLGS
jgi:hypothetical protein